MDLETARQQLEHATTEYHAAEDAFWQFYRDQIMNPQPNTPERDEEARRLVAARNLTHEAFHKALADHADAKYAVKGAA